MPRRLKSEGRNVVRKVEIVVDGLRHVNDAQRALCLLREAPCAERRAVAADRDELPDAERFERLQHVVETALFARGVRARDADVRAASKVDACGVADGKRHHVGAVALHEPAKAVLNADDFDAGEHRTNRCGADDRVDARRRTAGRENRKLGMGSHGREHDRTAHEERDASYAALR